MITSMVRNQIESSLNSRRGRAAFIDRMNELADEQDILLFGDDVDGLVVLGERYVRGSLRLLENCKVAAQQSRVEQMFDPLIDGATEYFLRPPSDMPDPNGLLGMMCSSFLARSLIAIASERMRAVRGFPLLANDPHAEAAIVTDLIGRDLANKLYDLAETRHDSPQIRFYANNAYLLQNSLRASANVNDWGGGWEDDARRFIRSVGLKLTPSADQTHSAAPLRTANYS